MKKTAFFRTCIFLFLFSLITVPTAADTVSDAFFELPPSLKQDAVIQSSASIPLPPSLLEEEKPEQSKYIYDITPEEKEMLLWIVQGEAGCLDGHHKSIITNVILNRVKSSKFPNTVEEVIFQKGQFATLYNYLEKKIPPDDVTREVVEKVLLGEIEDFSRGAVFFYSPAGTPWSRAEWFETKLTFVFELDGHRFFI